MRFFLILILFNIFLNAKASDFSDSALFSYRTKYDTSKVILYKVKGYYFYAEYTPNKEELRDFANNNDNEYKVNDELFFDKKIYYLSYKSSMFKIEYNTKSETFDLFIKNAKTNRDIGLWYFKKNKNKGIYGSWYFFPEYKISMSGYYAYITHLLDSSILYKGHEIPTYFLKVEFRKYSDSFPVTDTSFARAIFFISKDGLFPLNNAFYIDKLLPLRTGEYKYYMGYKEAKKSFENDGTLEIEYIPQSWLGLLKY